MYLTATKPKIMNGMHLIIQYKENTTKGLEILCGKHMA